MDTDESHQAAVPIDAETAKGIDKREMDQTPYEKALKEKQLGLNCDRPYGLPGKARPPSDRHVISLCGLIHWIAFRDAVSVPDLETHFGGSLAPMNWPYMLWTHALQNVAEKIDRASEELFAQIDAGKVTLRGLPKAARARYFEAHSTSIPSDVFAGPVTVELETNSIVLDSRRIASEAWNDYSGSVWRDVTARRYQCLDIWPPPKAEKINPLPDTIDASNTDGNGPSTDCSLAPRLNQGVPEGASVRRARAQSDFRAWLVDLMKSDPAGRTHAKARVMNDAMSQFVGLTKAAFKRTWAAAIQETNSNWNKAGRKTGSLQSEKIGSTNQAG